MIVPVLILMVVATIAAAAVITMQAAGLWIDRRAA